MAAEATAPVTKDELRKQITQLTKQMKQAAKELDFLQAAQFRDEMLKLTAQLEEMENKP